GTKTPHRASREVEGIVAGRHGDPFAFLGMHKTSAGVFVRALLPDAEEVTVIDTASGEIAGRGERIHPAGFFVASMPARKAPFRYRLRVPWGGHLHEFDDVYRFPPVLGELDIHLLVEDTHLGSWRRNAAEHGRYLSYRELAEQLVPYVADLGFTHIEVMPMTEYPFDGSWGYQPISLFAPTSRHGGPDECRAFIDACHRAGLGLWLDWVPGHFPTDAHGLGRFDGTALYEHADPRQGLHRDWNTLIYNYGRREVTNFLLSSALYWMREYHIDGLRVDA